MRSNDRMKRNVLVLLVMTLSIFWAVSAYALERRVGSLEFSYDSTADPVGMVILNHFDIKKPSIDYQIPTSPGGNFTAPWGIIIDGGLVIGDTLIMLTNPDAGATLSIDVILRDKDGVVAGDACTKTITLGPKKTLLRGTKVLFAACPTVVP